ncbi:MAG TPA: TonB C-terminal domain-containing protein, partial [Minicystis sp.]|nr:TonB C-terminal domain-containing protein [Minicystis sp.]
VVAGARGGWSMDPANPGGDGSSRVAGKRRAGIPFQTPVHVGALGLGGHGIPGGPNINLTMPGLTQAVGDEKLRAEREADGASRRGEHAGRMAAATNFQKYRAAIENYDPSVKPGDKTALNAAAAPFATYLVTIHNKIHPLFADRELDSMDKSTQREFQDPKMYAIAELVIAPDTGRVIRRGIVKNSGSTAYDIIVLKAIDASGPYGKAPDAIVSPDGKVYLHWEFHRNHFDACSTRFAYPIMKRATAAPKKATPSPTGAPPKAPSKTPDERPTPPPGPLRPLRE